VSENEANGTGGDDEPAFDHTELEVLGRALIDIGRGLVRFEAGYKYIDPAQRQVRRQEFGRIVSLINALWPQLDAAIKADERPAILDHQRDAHHWHVDRLFRLMELAAKVPPKKDD